MPSFFAWTLPRLTENEHGRRKDRQHLFGRLGSRPNLHDRRDGQTQSRPVRAQRIPARISIARCGAERRSNRIYTTICTFDAATKALRFNPTEYRSKSPITGRDNTIYRVVRLNDDELCLRSPYNIEASTENEPFVMILLRRIR